MHGVSETTPKSVPCGSARQERRTRRVARTAAAAALLAASSLSAACRNHPEQPVPLLVVGVDGLEWRVVRELAQTGEIETLPRLAETGVSGLLDVPKPTLSPIIWTTIATGVGKNRHGIEGFTYRDENGRPSLFGSRDRRVKAVWNILGEAGLETWTIGWWATFPAEQVRGIMIAQVNAPLRRQGAIRKGGPSGTIAGGTFPRDLAPLVVKAVRHAEKDTALLIRKLIPTPQARWKDSARVLVEQSRWALIADRAYFRIALDLLSRRPPPALMQVYFGGADVLGHRFWRYTYPDAYDDRPSAGEIAAFGKVVPGYYAELDRMIGTLVDAFPKPANVVIVSDHGMRATRRHRRFDRPMLSGAHLGAPPAFFAAAGPSIANRGRTMASAPRLLGKVADVAPTILALLGRPPGADMSGRILREVLSPALPVPDPVPSYTPASWSPPAPDVARGSGATSARIEQLRALGYLD